LFLFISDNVFIVTVDRLYKVVQNSFSICSSGDRLGSLYGTSINCQSSYRIGAHIYW